MSAERDPLPRSEDRRARLEEALQAAGLGTSSPVGTAATVIVLLAALIYGISRADDVIGVVLIVVAGLGLVSAAFAWLAARIT